MRRFGIWANGNCAFLVALAISTSPAFGNPFPKTGPEIDRPQKVVHPGRSFPFMSAPSRCETAGRQQITIMCDYAATPRAPSDDGKTTRIVLNRILISFEPTDESHMHVNLTFTNGGTTRISRAHTAYLVIDDDAGQNHVRRVLQQVDFRKIAPRQRLAFSEWLLISSFRPGHYTIYLWIPDPDPSLKFISSRNFLLSSVGVADPQTGLNALASFTVMP
jgi:hypothetical protein